jgi:hypothetical protein
VSVSESADSDGYINIAECEGVVPDELVFQWTVAAGAFRPGGTYNLLASDTAGCPVSTNTVARTAFLGSVPATSTLGTLPTTRYSHAGFLLATLAITCVNPQSAIFLCVTWDSSPPPAVDAGRELGRQVATGTVRLDLLAPPACTLERVDAGGGALTARWSSPVLPSGSVGAPAAYRITATATDNPSDVRTLDVAGGSTVSARVDGLRTGVPYDVSVIAVTAGGNQSIASNVIRATP